MKKGLITTLVSLLALLAFANASWAQEPTGDTAAEGGEATEAKEATTDDGAADEPAPATTEGAEGTEGTEDPTPPDEATPPVTPDPTTLIPKDTPDSKKEPDKLKRDGQEAQDARKAAMKALASKHPAKDADGLEAIPASSTPIPSPSSADLMPRIEHHGYFRFRADLFNNLDLNTKGPSPIAPPLDSKERGDAQPIIQPTDADTLAGANIRLRYAPIIHLTESLRIFSTLDILDNLVLGSTPDGMRAGRIDVPIIAFSGSAEEPRIDTIGKESVVVRSAFAEVKTLFGVLRAGRMPSDWGLGILANGGGTHSSIRKGLGEPAWDCVDCNHGDFVDRIMFLTKDPIYRAFYIVFAWDFVSEGLVGYNAQNNSYGQAFDMAQADDVTQFVIALFSRPMVKQEIDERNRDFIELRKPVFDWGVYFVYRTQDADLTSKPSKGSYVGTSSYADLEPRGVTAYIPDLWARFAYSFGYQQHLKVELEGTGIFGRIDKVNSTDTIGRDLQQFGLAMESEVRLFDGYFGLNAGLATGKDSLGFGYQDILATGDPSSGQVQPNINNFRFDQNYLIDMIMFRELVGGITNAIYFNPWGAYTFPIEEAQSFNVLGARLDVITAIAPKPESTPGQASWYGLETDLKLFYEEVDRYKLELAAGLFVPGPVWTRKAKRDGTDVNYPILPTAGVYPNDLSITKDLAGEVAWTIQSNIFWLF